MNLRALLLGQVLLDERVHGRYSILATRKVQVHDHAGTKQYSDEDAANYAENPSCGRHPVQRARLLKHELVVGNACLLYTSDAADDAAIV